MRHGTHDNHVQLYSGILLYYKTIKNGVSVKFYAKIVVLDSKSTFNSRAGKIREGFKALAMNVANLGRKSIAYVPSTLLVVIYSVLTEA